MAPCAGSCVFTHSFYLGLLGYIIWLVGIVVGIKRRGLETMISNPLFYLAPQHGLEPRTRWLTGIASELSNLLNFQ